MEKTKILDMIVEHICGLHMDLQAPNRDGRINSSMNEEQVFSEISNFFATNAFVLENGFELKYPNARDWYDFAIVKKSDNDYFLPVNIKVTKLSTDNLNCKLGIYFALTGLLPTGLSNEINWESYFEKLGADINTNTDKDYYFLVVNKNDTSDCFWNSLKGLETLVANGNNLPFQANWVKNRSRVSRTHRDAVDFILGCFKESVYLRAEIKEHFDKFIKPHLAGE